MDALRESLNLVFWGNSLGQYGLFVLILLMGLAFKRFVTRLSGRLLFKLFEKHSRDVQVDRFLELMHKPVSFLIALIFAYIALAQLRFPEAWNMTPKKEFGLWMVLDRVYMILLYGTFIKIGMRMADFLALILIRRAEQEENKYAGQLMPFFIDFVKITIVLFGMVIILGSVFRINIGTLIAGLGIGGLAIALAAKETLENLLGSFTIFLDKPFVVGDMVRVAGITGVIEKVGFRSTRIRTLEKSFVTLPNKKMVDSELDNLSLRTFRRSNFTIGLTYSTSSEQIKAVVEDIQAYIDQHPNTNQDGRVRFDGFGASSLDIMIMYFVDTMDWTTYLNVKEEINYKIIEIVQKHGAEFAFPSTSIYIEKKPKE